MPETVAVKAETKAEPKPPVLPPAVAAERARCRAIVEECVQEMKKTLRGGSRPVDVAGVLERMILARLEA